MSIATDWQDIADSIRAELKGETARRAALVAAGHPPPTTYNAGGRSVSWNEYMSAMMQAAKDAQAQANAVGGDDGLIDEHYQLHT